MEGKEIKQTGIVNRNIEVKIVRGKTIINQSSKFDFDTIVVKPEHLKELALAICPELQLELEKAKELLKDSMNVIEALEQKSGTDFILPIISRLTTFLEASGN